MKKIFEKINQLATRLPAPLARLFGLKVPKFLSISIVVLGFSQIILTFSLLSFSALIDAVLWMLDDYVFFGSLVLSIWDFLLVIYTVFVFTVVFLVYKKQVSK